MSYSIDSISDDCYPNTTCLINKFNIREEATLAKVDLWLESHFFQGAKMSQYATCAFKHMMVRRSSPFRAKLIQTHDEPRLNPKTAWVHYRWVQTDTRLRIQAEKERLFTKKKRSKNLSTTGYPN